MDAMSGDAEVIGLNEWLFEFRVTDPSGGSISRRAMETFISAASAKWEDDHDLFVGFGLDSFADAQVTWGCRFPVCINRDGQLITQAHCEELLDQFRQYCSEQGWELTGGYRQFTDEELTLNL